MYKYEEILRDPSILNKYKSREWLNVFCCGCKTIIKSTKNRLQNKLKRSHINMFCSNKCHANFKSIKNSIIVVCLQCEKQFSKINSAVSINNFCSRSCSVTYNNHVSPRIKLQGLCKCGCEISSSRSYCKKCFIKEKRTEWDNLSLSELKTKYKFQRYALIRSHARKKYKMMGRPLSCLLCQYNKHIEICHIKPISEFSDNATIKEINDHENLVSLCRNHHWELDHKLLDNEQLIIIKSRPLS